MIQLKNHLSAQTLIAIGKALEKYQDFEIGCLQVQVVGYYVEVILPLPRDNDLVLVQSFNLQQCGPLDIQVLEKLIEDYNTILNLKPPAEGLSNTR